MTALIPKKLTPRGQAIAKMCLDSAITKVAAVLNLPMHEVAFNQASRKNPRICHMVSEMIDIEVCQFLAHAKHPEVLYIYIPAKVKS